MVEMAHDTLAPASFSLPRLLAERLTDEHLPFIRRMDQDPRLAATLGGVRTEAETRDYLARNLAHWAEHGFGIWVLREPGTERLMGVDVARLLRVEESVHAIRQRLHH